MPAPATTGRTAPGRSAGSSRRCQPPPSSTRAAGRAASGVRALPSSCAVRSSADRISSTDTGGCLFRDRALAAVVVAVLAPVVLRVVVRVVLQVDPIQHGSKEAGIAAPDLLDGAL